MVIFSDKQNFFRFLYLYITTYFISKHRLSVDYPISSVESQRKPAAIVFEIMNSFVDIKINELRAVTKHLHNRMNTFWLVNIEWWFDSFEKTFVTNLSTIHLINSNTWTNRLRTQFKVCFWCRRSLQKYLSMAMKLGYGNFYPL